MKVSAIVTLGAASLASAQSIGSLVSMIPTCADSCLVKYIPMVCSGGITDYACSCMQANKVKITQESTNCVLSACGTTNAIKVQSITNEICSVFSAGGGASSSATMSSSASSASSMPASSSSSASMMASSAASSASSSASMMASSAASSSSSASMMASSGSAMATPTAVSTGGAASIPMITAAPAIAAAAAAMFVL